MADQRTSVGVIGAGAMGQALLRGLGAGGAAVPPDLWVTNRGDAVRLGQAASCGARVGDKGRICREAEVLLLAVKPKDVPQACRELAPHLRPGHLVVSVAAGVPRSALQERLGGHRRVVRAMPNTGSVIGASATAVAKGPDADDVRRAAVLLSCLGPVHLVPEEQMDAVTALSGSGPAYVYLLIEAMIDAGVAVGLSSDVARSLALQTALGAARMAMESGQRPQELRRAIASPGGTTVAALQVLERRGLREAVGEAVARASERAAEIARGL